MDLLIVLKRRRDSLNQSHAKHTAGGPKQLPRGLNLASLMNFKSENDVLSVYIYKI